MGHCTLSTRWTFGEIILYPEGSSFQTVSGIGPRLRYMLQSLTELSWSQRTLEPQTLCFGQRMGEWHCRLLSYLNPLVMDPPDTTTERDIFVSPYLSGWYLYLSLRGRMIITSFYLFLGSTPGSWNTPRSPHGTSPKQGLPTDKQIGLPYRRGP